MECSIQQTSKIDNFWQFHLAEATELPLPFRRTETMVRKGLVELFRAVRDACSQSDIPVKKGQPEIVFSFHFFEPWCHGPRRKGSKSQKLKF